MFKRKRLACSFCGKSETDVAKLVAGPRVYICDECVTLASRIMQGDSAEGPSPQETRPSLWQRLWSRTRRTTHRCPAQHLECQVPAR